MEFKFNQNDGDAKFLNSISSCNVWSKLNEGYIKFYRFCRDYILKYSYINDNEIKKMHFKKNNYYLLSNLVKFENDNIQYQVFYKNIFFF